MISIASYYILKNRHLEFANKMNKDFPGRLEKIAVKKDSAKGVYTERSWIRHITLVDDSVLNKEKLSKYTKEQVNTIEYLKIF